MGEAWRVLDVDTFACFAVWVLFGATGVPIRKEPGPDATERGRLAATQILGSSLLRLSPRVWPDRFDGRTFMPCLLAACAIPVLLVDYADRSWQVLRVGLILSTVASLFAAGTSCVVRLFPTRDRSFAIDALGAGTSGAALSLFVAPRQVDTFGWHVRAFDFRGCYSPATAFDTWSQ